MADCSATKPRGSSEYFQRASFSVQMFVTAQYLECVFFIGEAPVKYISKHRDLAGKQEMVSPSSINTPLILFPGCLLAGLGGGGGSK